MNKILNSKTVYNANSHNLHKDFEKDLYTQFVTFDFRPKVLKIVVFQMLKICYIRSIQNTTLLPVDETSMTM